MRYAVARCTSYLENSWWRLRQTPPDQFLRPDALQFSHTAGKASGFIDLTIVIDGSDVVTTLSCIL
jgi:hypothetical protein